MARRIRCEARLVVFSGPFRGVAFLRCGLREAPHIQPPQLHDGVFRRSLHPAGLPGLDVSLYDVFTDDEIFALWRLQNLSQYLRKGPSAIAGELAASIAKPLLRDMLACAEEAVAGGSVVADLRFGHGEGLMPLAALMRLEGACGVESDPEKVENVWNDFRITPMAGNIQLIFYRNAKGRVLVKFLLNEREVTVPVAATRLPITTGRPSASIITA